MDISFYEHKVLPTFALAFHFTDLLYLFTQKATDTPQMSGIPLMVIFFTSLNDFHVQQKVLIESGLFQYFISIS